MSENQIQSNGNHKASAGERLSTGALARWARMCANQSGRVMLVGALTFFALLAATILFHGNLRDQFEIPGSDTQKGVDLIETQFASEQGGVLNLVFAAPPGEQLDTPERKAAIEDALAKLKTQEFKATEDRAGIESGTWIRQKSFHVDAPSMAAASESSSGMFTKCARIQKTANGM